MGTRSLVIVIKNKEVKLAQYGQFDGYAGARGRNFRSVTE